MGAPSIGAVIDMRPAARRLAGVLAGISDEQLRLPTPCPEFLVGDVIDHVGMFAVRFDAAARKQTDGPMAAPAATSLGKCAP